MKSEKIAEKEEDIMNFGALSYTPSQMSILLDESEEEITNLLNNETEFQKIYNKGAAISQYLMDKKLFELARKGDLKAMEQFKFEQKLRSNEAAKSKRAGRNRKS